MTPEGVGQAIRQLEQALAKDHNFSDAFALLSYCYFVRWNFMMAGGSTEENLDRAQESAERAVTLNNNSGVAVVLSPGV